jgi:hypothetical protein
MAKWTNYYKLIQQTNIDNSAISDNQEIGTPGSYGNYNWYSRVIQGSGSRLTRYREWDNMDNDIDISRALDLIAEEITGNCTKHDDPIEINVIDADFMSKSEVQTVKTALRHWDELHTWKTRLFNISRYVVKYGDVFFKKKDIISKWKFIHPKDVTAAIVNSEDVTEIQAWQMKENIYETKSGGFGISGISSSANTETIDKNDVVRFTLNDDMSEEAPFGESVLKPIYKTFKQKELLEDAVIIYRIQRAPERRVFYIDVGKMPPNRVKQYLEQIKNEIRQKKIPTHNGNNSEIDSVYNAQSTGEDYFLATRSDSRGTKIETLPGGQSVGEISDVEYFSDKMFRGLRIPLSYMKEGDGGGAVFNDGKLGQSYITELRFSLYIERLQSLLEEVLDKEFKAYLRYIGLRIDNSKFNIVLPEPSNFGKYREQEMFASLLGSYSSADGIEYLSKKFIMKKYLQMSHDEIIENERMKMEEMGMDGDDVNHENISKIYAPDSINSEEEFGSGETDEDMTPDTLEEPLE